MQYSLTRFLAAIAFLAVGVPCYAQRVEEAAATVTPWSGWWWPSRQGHLIFGYRGERGPLVKHDLVSGRRAAAWEYRTYYHFSSTAAPWWGHCHAWATSSILEREPRRDVLYRGVPFRVGDIKGLLAEAHYRDRALYYGRRFNGRPGDDPQDMSPLLVWNVLRRHIYQNRTPVILDLSADHEVWSYPVYRYRVAFQHLGSGFYQGQLRIWAASFSVHPDAVGTTPEVKDYTFTFRASGSQLLFGSDQWTGASWSDHPDFAYYPTDRLGENPELDYSLVSQLNLQAR